MQIAFRPTLIILACLCGAAGCNSSTVCIVIEGQSYSSVEDLSVGLGPDGVVLGKWGISFSDGGFDWAYEDAVESGIYTCVGDQILGAGTGGREIIGSLDATSRRLIWDGVEYEEFHP